MSVKILVLSDGETWETFDGNASIMEITDEAFDELCDGSEPKHLKKKKDIIRISGIKEA